MVTPVGATDVTPRVSNRGTEYREAVTPCWEFETQKGQRVGPPGGPSTVGRTGQWVCRTKAQRRPLRAGRGSLGAAGQSTDGGEDEDCLLVGGSGAEQCEEQEARPLLPPSEWLWCLLFAEPLRGQLVEEPQRQHHRAEQRFEWRFLG